MATVRQELNDNWYLVEGLVNALIEKKTLTGKDVRRILIRQKKGLPGGDTTVGDMTMVCIVNTCELYQRFKSIKRPQ